MNVLSTKNESSKGNKMAFSINITKNEVKNTSPENFKRLFKNIQEGTIQLQEILRHDF